MVIANPIYDVAFKFLMEDDRIAKFFIGTILEETIEEVSLKPQEFVYQDDKGIGFAVFRLDFIATIRTATGELKKVLIEIQKAKNPIDLMRFRNYLGEQYKKEDEIDGEKVVLPIVTIYILGFRLPEIDACVVKVSRQYIDMLTHQVIDRRSAFIEKLSHDCYVVQLRRIPERILTKLEQLLSVFEQNFFVDQYGTIKEYKHPVADKDVQLMIDKLHYFGTEPLEKKKIEDEQEAYRIFDLYTKELLDKVERGEKALALKENTIAEKENTIAEKESTIAEKENTIAEKENVIEEKERTIAEKENMIAEYAKMVEDLKRRLEEK